VAAFWHRARGPALLHRLLEADSHTCCVAVGPTERRYFEGFLGQLEVYGSPRLRACLAQYRPVLFAVLLRLPAAS
jgi:hypothetical protein